MQHHFQKLKVWEKSMQLAAMVHLRTTEFPAHELYGLTSQMRRSAVSVPSNIAEGSQRTSVKDFCHFLLIAKGSLAELHTQTLLAVTFKYVSQVDMKPIIILIQEIDKMLHSLHSKLTS